MRAEKQQQNIDALLKLIKENPDLEILPMVDSECVQGDDFAYWMGKWGAAEIDEYYCFDERIYFKDSDYEELVEKYIDDSYGDASMNCEEYERVAKKAEKVVDDYEWVKAIVVHIDTPQQPE